MNTLPFSLEQTDTLNAIRELERLADRNHLALTKKSTSTKIMAKKQPEIYHGKLKSLTSVGFQYHECESLLRIERTLRRWHELERGTEINGVLVSVERDRQGLPWKRVLTSRGEDLKCQVPDLEKGALNRLAKLMANHPELWYYVQTDPRGCALYVGKKDSPDEETYYRGTGNTRGIAICY